MSTSSKNTLTNPTEGEAMRFTTTKEEWVEALRSPDRKQARGVLKSSINGAMCCLGVLCDLEDPDGWQDRRTAYWMQESTKIQTSAVLKESMRPDWMTLDQMYGATGLNDRHEATFSEIADWVEAGMPVEVPLPVGGGVSDVEVPWIVEYRSEKEKAEA